MIARADPATPARPRLPRLPPHPQPSDVFTGSVRPVISIGTGISFFNATSQQSVPAGSIGATIALDQALDMPGVSDAASLQIVFRCPFRNVNLQTYGLPNADSSRFTMFFQNQALQNQGFGARGRQSGEAPASGASCGAARRKRSSAAVRCSCSLSVPRRAARAPRRRPHDDRPA